MVMGWLLEALGSVIGICGDKVLGTVGSGSVGDCKGAKVGGFVRAVMSDDLGESVTWLKSLKSDSLKEPGPGVTHYNLQLSTINKCQVQ